MVAKTIKTRILILSDTHALTFSSPSTPFSHPPPPNIDLLIHCGDLTRSSRQSLQAYQGALDLLAAFPATLKLVIAGNHDTALDPIEWAKRGGKPEMHDQITALMTGQEARKAGVVFLNEGLHTFDLENGASVKVYATPYTPLYSESAFKYPPNEDRFSTAAQISTNLAKGRYPVVSVATSESAVPSWPDVDVMVTHGPPLGALDLTKRGIHAGCPNLMRAVERARPRVHCYGHLHEGYGARSLSWEKQAAQSLYVVDVSDAKGKGKSKRAKGSPKSKAGAGMERTREWENPYPEPANLEQKQAFGEETIMVNAAISERGSGGGREKSKVPWVLEVELPATTANDNDAVVSANLEPDTSTLGLEKLQIES